MAGQRLEDILWLTEAEAAAIVGRRCRAWRCPDVDDVTQEVLLHVLAKHKKEPTYFVSREHVAGTISRDAWHVLNRGKNVARRVKRDPADPDSLSEAGTSFEEQQWQRLRALAADCDKLADLIVSAPAPTPEVFR